MKNLKNNFLYSLLLLVFLNTQIGFAQFTIPEVPKFQTSVYDYAKVLSDSEKAQLEEKLVRYSDSTTTQIVIITIESLKGEDIGILTPKWAHQWGIGGTKKDDNGVLILLAKDERKIWIAPGYGLEDRLTAGIGGEITRNIIVPEFKAGSYYNGLDKGTDAIIDVFKGKYKGTRKQKSADFPILPFIIILALIIFFISKNKRGGGGGNSGGFGGGPSILDAIILSNLGRGGSGFGGGSSGGFGGGGFSGGGSGGSW